MPTSDRHPAPSAFADRRRQYAAGFVSLVLGLGLCILVSLRDGWSAANADFPGRRNLIAIISELRLALGDRVFNQTLVGPDGWLEYFSVANPGGLQNGSSLPPGAVADMQKNLALLAAEFERRGITLIVAVAPDKVSIYPDMMPAELQPVQPLSDLDQLVAATGQFGPANFIDLRPALRAARTQHDVYYQTDSHWNAYGALVGYSEIMRAASAAYPQLAPLPLEAFDLLPGPPTVRDIPPTLGLTTILEPGYAFPDDPAVTWIYLNNDNIEMRTSTTAQAAAPRALMYIDSFGALMVPFFAPHFSQATYIENLSKYEDLVSFAEIDAVQPDIVVVEFVERYLPEFNLWLQQFVDQL